VLLLFRDWVILEEASCRSAGQGEATHEKSDEGEPEQAHAEGKKDEDLMGGRCVDAGRGPDR